MFDNYVVIKSSSQTEAWLRAIVSAYGTSYVSFPQDCETIVRHFANVGVHISIEDAASFWDAYSENLQSGWIALSQDCVAALDGLVEDIERGRCSVKLLADLKGTVLADATIGSSRAASSSSKGNSHASQ